MQVPNTIVISMAKGGAGKTTLATNLAACMAEEGERILLVDLDLQGNATTQLGIDGEEHGSGSALAKSLMFGDPLPVVEGRPNLDVVVGGTKTKIAMGSMTSNGLDAGLSSFVEVFEPLAATYDWLIFDTPPAGQNMLTDVCLMTSQYLIIPYREAAFYPESLMLMASLLSDLGSPIHLLGVAMWGHTSEKQQRDAHAFVSEVLEGTDAEMFETSVREANGAYRMASDNDVLVTELASWAAGLSFKERSFDRQVPKNVEAVSASIWDLSSEIRAKLEAAELERFEVEQVQS